MAWVGPKVKVALVVLALFALVILANRLNGQLKPNEELIDGEVYTYELRVCEDPCPDYPEPVETTSSSRPWPWPS
jgi:hypothetical protein